MSAAEGSYVHNDSHRPFWERWKVRRGGEKKGRALEVSIPDDGVAFCSADEIAWIMGKEPDGRDRNTQLKRCTKAEAEAHCKRRGRELPAGGSKKPKPDGGSK